MDNQREKSKELFDKMGLKCTPNNWHIWKQAFDLGVSKAKKSDLLNNVVCSGLVEKITKEQVLEALNIIDRFKDQSKLEVLEIFKIVKDNRPIQILNLGTREFNCLKAGRINCIGDILNTTQSELCKFRNLSEKGVAKIESEMIKLGMTIPLY